MKMPVLGALIALSITAPAFAAIKETPVSYSDGETTMKGFVVYDTAEKGRRPGITRRGKGEGADLEWRRRPVCEEGAVRDAQE